MAMGVDEAPGSSLDGPRHRSWLPWVAAAAALAVGALVVVVVVSDDDLDMRHGAVSGMPQLAAIQHACDEWRGGHTAGSTPSSGWCGQMVGWMTGQMRSGRMTGPMMWADPARMRSTCQAWWSSSQRSGDTSADPSELCDQMVDWMTEHMGDWDRWDQGWMMDGPMMGG